MRATAVLGYGADFDRQGRLVTTSFDGAVRLYDPSLKLLRKEKAGGAKPYIVRFSPDGQKVAVGYDDNTRVDILSGKDSPRSHSRTRMTWPSSSRPRRASCTARW